MNLLEFIAAYYGEKVDVDGQFGGQCVDLFRRYCYDVIGIPYRMKNPIPKAVPGARCFFENYHDDPDLMKNFDRIVNTVTAIPRPGDVMFWNKNVGSGYGHVAIYIAGDLKEFDSFDQNWPTFSKCTITHHTYDNVTGWLRPRKDIV
jgi:hypothetical protein